MQRDNNMKNLSLVIAIIALGVSSIAYFNTKTVDKNSCIGMKYNLFECEKITFGCLEGYDFNCSSKQCYKVISTEK